MTLTVRLDPDLETRFADACERRRESKSKAVKRLIEGYLDETRATATPYELAHDLIDGEDDGVRDASVRYKSRIAEKVRAKHAR
jgi:predicted DNA-binding protein